MYYYNSEYKRGYEDGFKAGVAAASQQQHQQPKINVDFVPMTMDEYYERNNARKQKEYDDSIEELFDDSSDDSYYYGQSYSEKRAECRNPYDESDSDSDAYGNFYRWPSLGIRHSTYRTFVASDFKYAKDMIPHLSETSQWFPVVSEEDFTDLFIRIDTWNGKDFFYQWENKDVSDVEKKRLENIGVRTRQKRDVKPLPKIGTHEERKKTKKILREKRMAKKKAVRSSKKDNRRIDCTSEE